MIKSERGTAFSKIQLKDSSDHGNLAFAKGPKAKKKHHAVTVVWNISLSFQLYINGKVGEIL